MKPHARNLLRYGRQTAFASLGASGQRRLMAGRALIVGVGGLGSWVAELLARSGVGMLRLADDDRVDITNIHRQAMYDERDAAERRLKVEAAAACLSRINADVAVETAAERLDAANVARLADGVHVIMDGTDNFATRFVINDYCVKTHLPWVFAGVVGSQAQTMTVVPGRTACLRCVFDSPPPPCVDPSCRTDGVMAPAVAAIASVQAAEAIKILSGRAEDASPYLLKLDLWKNTLQRIDAAAAAADNNCPCCKRRQFEFLEE